MHGQKKSSTDRLQLITHWSLWMSRHLQLWSSRMKTWIQTNIYYNNDHIQSIYLIYTARIEIPLHSQKMSEIIIHFSFLNKLNIFFSSYLFVFFSLNLIDIYGTNDYLSIVIYYFIPAKQKIYCILIVFIWLFLSNLVRFLFRVAVGSSNWLDSVFSWVLFGMIEMCVNVCERVDVCHS